jgi:hypothetical protein
MKLFFAVVENSAAAEKNLTKKSVEKATWVRSRKNLVLVIYVSGQ